MPTKPKTLELRDLAPALRKTALQYAGGDRSRISVLSWSRAQVDLPQDAKKPRPSEEDRGSR